MDTGMMSTGKMTTIVTATGRIIRMDTTAYALSGGIHGGGIGSGGVPAGAIASAGISSTADSIRCGTTVAVGGTGHDMDGTVGIDCHTRMVRYDAE